MAQSNDQLNAELLEASRLGDEDEVLELLKRGAHAYHQETEHGRSAMMLAADNGHTAVVKALLEAGAPWNAVDRQGQCAGQYAVKEGYQDIVDMLVNAGVSAELLFYTMAQRTPQEKPDYLDKPVRYQGDDLLDEQDRGVMMTWEQPLMEMHAEIMCQTKGDVINVGFGLGLIDTAIQKHNPKSHTIIEAHPNVLARMRELGWYDKPNVRIVEGRWQDVVDQLEQYDGIFFDTFDDVQHMNEFHQVLPRLLRKGGMYSFFNGICTENIFFQGVACQVLQIQLEQLGFNSQFAECAVDSGDDKTWQQCSFRYFSGSTYYLPIVTWKEDEAANTEASAENDAGT